MSTTPPEQPPTDEPRARIGGVTMASNLDIARLPIPGNAELLVYLLVWLVLTLIWLFSDEVGAGTFATLPVALTFGYLISRGIAKASRVLEQ
jgi:hypothetical protein